MAREQLETAATHLRAASDSAEGDAVERLTDLAGQLDTLATRERGPDHGRLARIQAALDEVRDTVGENSIEDIDAAEDAISAYRETIEGV